MYGAMAGYATLLVGAAIVVLAGVCWFRRQELALLWVIAWAAGWAMVLGGGSLIPLPMWLVVSLMMVALGSFPALLISFAIRERVAGRPRGIPVSQEVRDRVNDEAIDNGLRRLNEG